MKKTPENSERQLEETDGDGILTPSEIGALSPRVPRRPEMLRDAPKPIEARIYDADENEIVYIPESLRGIVPDTQFIKSGDRKKQPLIFKGKTKEGNVVLENEDGEGIVISSHDFESGYERLRRIYTERTRDGKEVKLDTEAVLKESVGFYTTHDLKDFLKDLPKEIRLSAQSEARLREALKEGFDSAMLLPSIELQKGNINKLLTDLADKQLPGLPDAEQYSQAHYMYEPDVTKAATSRNRPSRKAYLLLYQSGPIPDETKGLSPGDQAAAAAQGNQPARPAKIGLDTLFAQKKWNGLTLEEYVILQMKEIEARKNHSFDAYNSSDAKKSQWTWLLDSRVPRGVVHAHWSPRNRQVGVFWLTPGSSNPGLGARPAVVVEIEI